MCPERTFEHPADDVKPFELLSAASAAGYVLHTVTLYWAAGFVRAWNPIATLIAAAVTFTWNHSAR